MGYLKYSINRIYNKCLIQDGIIEVQSYQRFTVQWFLKPLNREIGTMKPDCRYQPLTRSTYWPVRVSIRILSPSSINGGT
jgi:hypothetical protein